MIAGRIRAERTKNMNCMSVTLEVSRLSEWLNADACCRVERGASEEGRHGGPVAGVCGEASAQASSVQGGPNCGGCWQGTRGAHQKHLQHACDAGRVEAQRLVEHRRGLPSRKGSVGTGATCGLGGGRVWGGGSGASIVLAGPNCCRLLAGARAERTSSMYPMFATLDVSKLSGWLNAFALCRVEREA